MEEANLIQRLRAQALEDYKSWCAGREPEEPEDGHAALGDLPAGTLLRLLNKLSNDIPTGIDYHPIYCACVLHRNFRALQNGMASLPELCPDEMEILFRFARIFLNVGCYAKCIDCCDLCLKEPYAALLPPERHMEVLFARSKARRNMGEYLFALDDLRQALRVVDQHPEIAYWKGAVLVRIGKVYSQFLMMMSVSLCFLQEAKDQLTPWLSAEDPEIRKRAQQEYAICLDSIGQYWKGKGEREKAVAWFQAAQKINEDLGRTAGIFRTESHMIMTKYPELLGKQERSAELDRLVRALQYIVRKLQDDHTNQRGLAVRLLHLSEIQARMGNSAGARYSMDASRKMARLYRDDKTLIKLKIAELRYGVFQSGEGKQDLRDTLDLARERKYYGYEIQLHDAVIEAIRRQRLSRDQLLNSLSRSRTLYLQLSNIAQNTIEKISNLSEQPEARDEFSYLSEQNSKDLLVKVVHDYDLFIQKMNEIIDQLLQITEQRSKDLNKALLAEAKASLASGVLHDLKHILASDGDETCLDIVLERLEGEDSGLPRENRRELMEQIQMVNANLKEKIFPRIRQATRVPNDFRQAVNVLEIFSEVRQLRLEKQEGLPQPGGADGPNGEALVTVDCPDRLSIVYNREIFFNLIKEMYRNAVDYQRRTQAAVTGYLMRAQEQDGVVEVQILTQFRDEALAQAAAEAISDQLRAETAREDGFGIRMLRSFVQHKTGGVWTAAKVNSGTVAGIRFSVPRGGNTYEEWTV